MAQGDTPITITGNLADDPQLRYTPAGQAVANFRVISTPRIFDKDSGQWKDGESLFLTCNIWRQPAENVAESLQRGMRVIVTGRLKQRQYETKEGEKRTVYEIEADEVGTSLKFATVKVSKSSRSSGSNGGGAGGGGWGEAPAQPAAQGAQGGGQAAGDPWASGPAASGFTDEPPF